MEHKELTEFLGKVSLKLKDLLPKGGTSLMITSNGEGGVFCHIMGQKSNLLVVLCSLLEQNSMVYELLSLAVKTVSLQKNIDTDIDKFLDSLLEAIKNKDEKSGADSATVTDTQNNNP